MSASVTTRVRRLLIPLADAGRAEGMRAYMKSDMPCLGVPAPARREVTRALAAALAWTDARAWRRDVTHVWENAKYREERYAAIDLARARQARPHRDLEALPMYERMIVTGAWWDFVDEIASHLVGELLLREPRPMRAAMRAWSRSPMPNARPEGRLPGALWKRRTAILSQLRRGAEVDLALLYDCLEPSLRSSEFFLQKAIGWALRQVAWTQPDEVRRYVLEHASSLSPLSKREALKNIGA